MNEKFRYWMLVLPALAVMILFYIWPVLNIWGISVTEPSSGLGNYTRMFDSNAVRVSFVLTFRVAAITTVACLLLGYVLAYTISNFATRVSFIVSLIAVIGVSFLIEMFFAKPDLAEVASGLIPSIPDGRGLYIAIGIIGLYLRLYWCTH